MNDSVLSFLSMGSAALAGGGFALVFLLWWPFRKTGAVQSLPWFMAAMVLVWGLSSLSRSSWMQYMQALNETQNAGGMTLKMQVAAIVFSTLWTFLCYVILVANAGYLLERLGFTSGVTRVLKRVYDFTTPIGLALLVTSACSGGLIWIAVNVFLRVKEIEG